MNRKSNSPKRVVRSSARKFKFAIRRFKSKQAIVVIPFFIIAGTVAGIVFDNLLLCVAISVAVGVVLTYVVDNNKN